MLTNHRALRADAYPVARKKRDDVEIFYTPLPLCCFCEDKSPAPRSGHGDGSSGSWMKTYQYVSTQSAVFVPGRNCFESLNVQFPDVRIDK